MSDSVQPNPIAISPSVRGFKVDIYGNIVIETGLSASLFPNATLMLYLAGDDTEMDNAGDLYIYDVKTGQSKKLGYTIFLGHDGNESIHLENYGWISLSENVDYETFSKENNFTNTPIGANAHLDAYYKFIVNG